MSPQGGGGQEQQRRSNGRSSSPPHLGRGRGHGCCVGHCSTRLAVCTLQAGSRNTAAPLQRPITYAPKKVSFAPPAFVYLVVLLFLFSHCWHVLFSPVDCVFVSKLESERKGRALRSALRTLRNPSEMAKTNYPFTSSVTFCSVILGVRQKNCPGRLYRLDKTTERKYHLSKKKMFAMSFYGFCLLFNREYAKLAYHFHR